MPDSEKARPIPQEVAVEIRRLLAVAKAEGVEMPPEEDVGESLDWAAWLCWCGVGLKLFALRGSLPTLDEAGRAADSVMIRIAAERERGIITYMADALSTSRIRVRKMLKKFRMYDELPDGRSRLAQVHRHHDAR